MLKKNSPYFAFNCKLCEKTLRDNFKALPCLHSYCFQCLVENFTEQFKRSPRYGLPDNFFDEDEKNVVHCPDCFMEVPVTKDEAKTVHANATDSVNQLETVSFLTHLLKTVTQLNLRRKCERCISVDDSTPAAIAFCKDCEKSYCSTCLDKHKEFSAGHTLLDLEILNENRMILVSDDSDFKEECTLKLRNTNSSSLEGSSDFLELSIADDRDASFINVSKNSKMKHISYLSYVQTEGLVMTNLKPCKMKSELDAEFSDKDQRLNPSLDDALSASAGPIYNFNSSATASSINRKVKKVGGKFKNGQALRNVVIASKCSIHKLPFIAYCSRCELCLCQLCWEQHSTEFKDCMNIVPLKTVAFEKRTQGYALLAAARQLIRLLNEKCSESLKKLQHCAEKCFDENDVVNSNLDIDTIQAFQCHNFRQNQLYCKQLFCFMTFLKSVIHLVPDADLTICFRSITAFWHRLSSKFIKKTTLSEIEPTTCNFLYGKVETLSVAVDQDNLDYSEKKSFQSTRASMMEKEHTVQSMVIDITRRSVISSYVVDSKYFALKEIDYISAICVSNDLHILLCLYFQSCIKIYDSKGQSVTTVQTPGEPSDICANTNDSTFLVVLPLKKKIVILKASKPDKKTTFFLKRVIDVKRSYVSILIIFNSIIACDVYKNVDIIKTNGIVVRSLLKQTKRNKPSPHRLSPGPFANTFLLLDYLYQTISCYDMNGCLQFCIDTTTERSDSNGTSDICLGKSGRIYISDSHSIYSMDSTDGPQVLWTFEEELTEEACIVFTPVTNHLIVSCFAGIDKSLLILNIFHP